MRVILVLAACSAAPVDIGREFDGAMPADGLADLAVVATDSLPADPDAGGPILCGAVLCHAGQNCLGGKCQFPCSGVTVPGMFPTLEAASQSLLGSGGTICVEAGSFNEQDQVFFDRALTVIGVSPDVSRFTNQVQVSAAKSQSATLTVKGIGFEGELLLRTLDPGAADARLELVASRMSGGVVVSFDQIATYLFDGDDLIFPAGTALHLSGPGTRGRVQNCFIHGSLDGIFTSGGASAEIVNNTILGNDTAFEANSPSGGVVTNNLVVGNNFGQKLFTQGWTVRGNDFFGNSQFHPALDPINDNLDPLIDMQAPPALGAGSPCRGAGNATVAPATDFFGRPRTGAVDIGARQDP